MALANKARPPVASREAEWQQCHFRLVTVCLAITYSAWHQLSTPMLHVALAAIVGAGCWYLVVLRDVGRPSWRIVIAMTYDCAIVSWAMLILQTSGVGLYCIFLWISVGYSIRYKRPAYALVGSALTLACFTAVAVVTGLANAHPTLVVGVAASLIFAPLRIAQLLKKLIASERVRDEFIANMSHDLLTPINSIMGFSERIRSNQAQDSQDCAEHIYASAHLLASLIRSVIDATSLEAAERTSDFSVQEVVRMVTGASSNLAGEKGLVIVADVDIGFLVRGPESVVIRCLLNLVDNAVKYADRGRVCISARYDRKKSMLCFEVADEGPGIEVGLHERIFDRFYRAPSSVGIAGSGIGLTGARKSLESVGGSIELRPAERGAVFSFCVPARISSRKPAAERHPGRAAGFCIMLVDDDELSCKAWSSNLVDAGYRVTTAGTPFEALRIINHRPQLKIDMFVLDYRMPGMSGIVLAQEIKSIRKAPVLLVSADPPALFDRFVAVGVVDGVLQKPFSVNSLLGHIEQHLAASPSSGPAMPDELKSELRRLYLGDLLSNIELLRRDVGMEELAAIAHKLRGSAAIVGDRPVLNGLAGVKDDKLSPQTLLPILLCSDFLSPQFMQSE